MRINVLFFVKRFSRKNVFSFFYASWFLGVLARPDEVNFWMWILTLSFLCIAILVGLVAAVFTMVNVIYVPISDIAGVRGVYVWNAVACKWHELRRIVENISGLLNRRRAIKR